MHQLEGQRVKACLLERLRGFIVLEDALSNEEPLHADEKAPLLEVSRLLALLVHHLQTLKVGVLKDGRNFSVDMFEEDLLV